MKKNNEENISKEDPLSIVMCLAHHLNLLEMDAEHSVNTLKVMSGLHWLTIKKYLMIVEIIKKSCPTISLNDSKFSIVKSPIRDRLNHKERLILYLFSKQALDEDSAVELPDFIERSKIQESISYLFNETIDKKFYVKPSGIDVYKSINRLISELIYTDKTIDEVLG